MLIRICVFICWSEIILKVGFVVSKVEKCLIFVMYNYMVKPVTLKLKNYKENNMCYTYFCKIQC